jgi:hypothetical protein
MPEAFKAADFEQEQQDQGDLDGFVDVPDGSARSDEYPEKDPVCAPTPRTL